MFLRFANGDVFFSDSFAGNGPSDRAWLNYQDRVPGIPLPEGDVPNQASHGSHGSSPPPSNVITGTTASAAAGEFQWTGISFSSIEGYYYPPDNGFAANAAAAGSQEAIAAENGAIQSTVFTSLTSYTETTVSWTSFFTVQTGYSLTDPRVLFDATAGHFIIAVDEINTRAASSFLLYAVSNSSTPTLDTSNWHFYSVSTTHNATWSDQPLVAENNGDLYVTTNQFTASGHYQSDYLTIVSDYGTNVAAATAQQLDSPSYQPAAISDGTSATQYFVAHDPGSLHIFGITGSTVGAVETVGGLLPEFGTGSFAASESGTNVKLDAGDGRITGAAYDAANHQLYAVFEIQPSGSSSLPSVELVQVDLSGATPTVKADISLNSLLPTTGATSGAATFNASLAVDNAGDLLVNFNVSGPNMYPADYYAEWKAPTGGFTGSSPLPSTPTALIDYQNSVAAYVDPAHDSVSRWGDYSTVVADANPSAANGFWLSNEFDNGTAKIGTQTYSSWGTDMAHVLA